MNILLINADFIIYNIIIMKTLEERIDKALKLRKEGYSCASAVLMSFDDITGLDDNTALAITNGLGTGIGGTREICGAAATMAIVEGFLHPASPSEKVNVATQAGTLIKEFKAANMDCVRCADLKNKQSCGIIRPCNELVTQCVELLHKRIATR